MQRFGIFEIWIDIIYHYISSCWFSVLINGESCGFFSSSRGLRQGDTLSPSLFIIAVEVLSRGLNHMHVQYPHISFQSSLHVPVISHLSYADDVIIYVMEQKGL